MHSSMYPSLSAIEDLLPHEEVSAHHLEELLALLREDGIIHHPIIVDRASRVILDGHHRWNAVRILKLRLVPVYFVDIADPLIVVEPFRPDVPVSKSLVIETGKSRVLLPWKTTRHVYGTERIPIGQAFPPVPILLSLLQ